MLSTLDHSQMTVVRAYGHLNAANAYDLQKALIDSSLRHHSLLVDMSQVESIDRDGLMALVSVAKLAKRSNRRFSLCGVSPSVRIIFELTQLDRAVEIFESPTAFEAAIAA